MLVKYSDLACYKTAAATKEGGGHGADGVDGWQGPCSVAQDQGQSSACK